MEEGITKVPGFKGSKFKSSRVQWLTPFLLTGSKANRLNVPPSVKAVNGFNVLNAWGENF